MTSSPISAASINGALDPGSPLPLYYQLKHLLLRHIQSGDLAPGEPFPSEKELEERHGVSRITVRRALSDLATEGYISRQAGRGTFVLPPKLQDRSEKLGGFIDDLIAQGFQVRSEILDHSFTSAPLAVAEALDIAADHPVLYFEKLVYADGEPIALALCYFNIREHADLSLNDLNLSSIYPLLEQRYGIVLRRADKTIEATAAREREAHLMRTEPGAPMLLATLLIYDDSGKPSALVKALYRGDRYKYYSSISR
jgi:GntR family transcriptional regulator